MLKFHLDTLKVDSVAKARIADSLRTIPRGLRTPGTLGQVWKTLPGGAQGWANDSAESGGGGRTYVSLNPFGYMNALRILDSTDQNYMLYVPYAIQWVQGYRNFANGANDSALVQNVAGSYSILPPSILGEWITFTNVTVRTTYGTAVAQELFPFAMTQASADTAIYSATLVCRTISSVRHYYIRIYKHYTSSFSGINPPLTGGTLVTSVEVTNALFPNAATSTYALISIGYRRIQ